MANSICQNSTPIPAHPHPDFRDGLAGKKQNLNGDSGDSVVSSLRCHQTWLGNPGTNWAFS